MRTQPAASFGRIGSRIRSQASPVSSRAAVVIRNDTGWPTAFLEGKVHLRPDDVAGPRQIVRFGVRDLATNVP